MAATVDRAKQAKFASVTVVEPLPMLMIRTGKPDEPTVLVEGMSGDTAVAMDWGAVIDFGIALGKKIFGDGGGGGGGGGKGCTTIKITNPDGSSTEIKQCPPPA